MMPLKNIFKGDFVDLLHQLREFLVILAGFNIGREKSSGVTFFRVELVNFKISHG